MDATYICLLLQLVVIGPGDPLVIQLAGLTDQREYICHFGLPSGRYRMEWMFKVIQGYAFIRDVSYSSGVCNYTGWYYNGVVQTMQH